MIDTVCANGVCGGGWRVAHLSVGVGLGVRECGCAGRRGEVGIRGL